MSSYSNNVVTIQRVGNDKFVVTSLVCKTQVIVTKSKDMILVLRWNSMSGQIVLWSDINAISIRNNDDYGIQKLQ